GIKEGRALLEEAVRREPDNVVAWAVLASATRRLDPQRSRQARAPALELGPPPPRARPPHARAHTASARPPPPPPPPPRPPPGGRGGRRAGRQAGVPPAT